ncbi:hypothetical protein [Halolamina salifodinae]|uniref:Uncharacterized protein n=1 Tax=Halolamina salifodinae TaxID=1202767 RepID=A0A8T4GYQ2_9EURY|nr:hypothetical protein [Halolamina salifodinae]MBP1986684.1 hypothetical protein [Halolamina salifodinae]
MQYSDNRTYRTPPTFGMALLFAALPLAALFAAMFPAATAGLVVGWAGRTALQR